MKLPENYKTMDSKKLRDLIFEAEKVSLPENVYFNIEAKGFGSIWDRHIENIGVRIKFYDSDYKTVWRKINFVNGELDSKKLKQKIEEITKLFNEHVDIENEKKTKEKDEESFEDSLDLSDMELTGNIEDGYSLTIHLKTREQVIETINKIRG